MSKLLNKTFLQENRKVYLMLGSLCFFAIVCFYFISQIVTSFVSVDQSKIDVETTTYIQELSGNLSFDKSLLQSILSEDSIQRQYKECDLSSYRGAYEAGCPILIPDNDQFGDRYNPFDVDN